MQWPANIIAAAAIVWSSAAVAAPLGCSEEDPLARWTGAWENKIAGLVLAIDAASKRVQIVQGGVITEMGYEVERCVGSAIVVKAAHVDGKPRRFVLHTGGNRLQFAPEGDTYAMGLERSK